MIWLPSQKFVFELEVELDHHTTQDEAAARIRKFVNEWPTLARTVGCTVTTEEDREAIAGELARVRSKIERAIGALKTAGEAISHNGCECECKHHYEDHDEGCDRCLACRVGDGVDDAMRFLRDAR